MDDKERKILGKIEKERRTHAIGRVATDQEILDLWKTTNQPISVYVHAAFCIEQCTYCTFKGTRLNKSASQQYYQDYLPSMIKFYEEILASDKINSYYWGGGTPTLIPLDDQKNLFDILPNFKKVKKKMMEMHICDWSVEQLNLLREYNFSNVVVCVQTFDSLTLKKYKRRIPNSIDETCELIRHANDIGLITNSDLLYLDTGDTSADINRLMTDIQILADNNISEISISTIFDEDGKFDNLVTANLEVFLEKNTDYKMKNTFAPFRDDIEISYRDKNDPARQLSARIFKKDVDEYEVFNFLPGLSEMGKWPEHVSNDMGEVPNVLGIGSYKNYKDTFSTIDDRIQYVEVGDLETPKFIIQYDKSNYPIKKLIADFYNKLDFLMGEESPDGVKFQFSTVIINDDAELMDQNYKEYMGDKRFKRELVISVIFPEYDNYIIKNYRKKLEDIWPHISKIWKFA